MRTVQGRKVKRGVACFLSAPVGAELSVVRQVLQDLNISVFDSYEPNADDRSYESVARKLARADFLLAIVTSEKNENVIYEMGVADGLGKPAFILVDRDERLPSFLLRRVHLKANFKETDVLRIALTRFIEDMHGRRLRPTRHQSTSFARPTKAPLDEKLTDLPQLRLEGGRAVERFVFKLLKDIHLTAVENPYGDDRGADLAIWSKHLAASIGNPLIVEVKAGDLSWETIRRAEEQLLAHTMRSGARFGLLLYLDRQNQRFQDRPSSTPYVIRFDVEDLVRQLQVTPFEKLIAQARNRLVHGIS